MYSIFTSEGLLSNLLGFCFCYVLLDLSDGIIGDIKEDRFMDFLYSLGIWSIVEAFYMLKWKDSCWNCRLIRT